MKLSNALKQVINSIKDYVDRVMPKKLSDLEIDMELGAVKTINGNEPDENGNVEIETGSPDALLFTEQSLTDEQKNQARANISKYIWRTFSDNWGTYTYAIGNNTVDYDIAQTIANTSGNGTISALEDIVSWIDPNTFYITAPTINMPKHVASNFNALLNGGALSSKTIIIYRSDKHDDVTGEIYISSTEKYDSTHSISFNTKLHSFYMFYNENTNSITKWLDEYNGVTTDLKYSGMAADAKTVGDALAALKADKSEIVQPDWNQNDENAKDYIKNRPFGEEDCILLDEEVTVDDIRVDFDNDAYVLVEGREYKVIFNNEETYVTAYYEDTDSAIRLVCEFESLTHDIYYKPDINTEENCWMWVDPALEHGDYSLKIIDASEVIIHQLDEKFIPDTIARTTTDEEILHMLAEANIIELATDENGDTFTDLNGNIIVF